MDWTDVRYFLALARDGSVRGAGAALGVSHSTVARRVEALEEALSTRLFDRSRDGYVLTEAGRQMVPGAERIEREMSALERRIVGRDRRLEGVVAITCCDSFVSGLLVAGLAGFCAAHPEIELQLTSDSRMFDLTKREADIAIRALAVGASPPEHLLGRKLVPVTLCNYVSVRHPGVDPEACDSARWVGFEDRSLQHVILESSSYPDLPVWGAFASLELMVQAGINGLGIVMLPTYVGDPEPRLRRLAKPDLRHMGDMWLLGHPDTRRTARFGAARAEVASVLEALHGLFAGECPGAATLGPEIAPLGRACTSVPCVQEEP